MLFIIRTGTLLAVIGVVIGGPSPVMSAANASNDETCAVIQAAMGSVVEAAGAAGPAYPKAIRAAENDRHIADDLTPRLAAFDLTDLERADLIKRSGEHPHAPFRPECQWAGRAVMIKEGSDEMTSEFTRPLFSSDGRIAVFSWSLYSPGRWAHGDTCLARKTAAGWQMTCSSSWLT